MSHSTVTVSCSLHFVWCIESPTSPTPATKTHGRMVFNFVSASKQEVNEKVARKTKKRGEVRVHGTISHWQPSCNSTTIAGCLVAVSFVYVSHPLAVRLLFPFIRWFPSLLIPSRFLVAFIYKRSCHLILSRNHARSCWNVQNVMFEFIVMWHVVLVYRVSSWQEPLAQVDVMIILHLSTSEKFHNASNSLPRIFKNMSNTWYVASCCHFGYWYL